MGNFRLPSKKEVFGVNKSGIFSKIGRKCIGTDFQVYLTGSTSSSWWLSSTTIEIEDFEVDKIIFCVDYLGDLKKSYRGDSGWIKIRPVMKYDSLDEIDKNPKRNNDGVLEVEYGEYPQDQVSDVLMEELEENYSNKKLKETGKKYTIKLGYINDNKETVPPVQLTEYEYDGKKYVRYFTKSGVLVWIEVSPIKWYVDEKRKLLISEKLLMGHIDYKKIPKFLNTYFAEDIIVKKTEKTEEKKTVSNKETANTEIVNEEVSPIEKQINEIHKYLEGNPNKDTIIKKLTEMIEDYNAKLDDVRNKRLNNVVTMDTYESITNAFELRLAMISVDVKKHHEVFKDYFHMLAVLDKYIALINGNKDEEYNGGFISDLDAIVSICLPFLNKEDADLIIKQLIGVFNDEKKEINNYIDGKGEVSYHTVDEMDLDLRKKIHPILRDLSTFVNKRDVEVEISTAVSKIIGGLFKQPENEALSFYLVEINNVYTEINDLIDKLPPAMKKEYKKEILDIMNMNIDYSKEFNDVANSLKTMWLSLNKVLFRLNNYISEIGKLYVGRIDVNKFNK